jgi:type II secretory pathway pseudopilin PulG
MGKNSVSKGFSLLEVLVTIFILAVVVITLIGIFVYGFNLQAKTKQIALATQVAQFEVERYRNMAFDSILPQSATSSTFVDLYNNDLQSPYKFMFNKDNEPFLVNGRETITIQSGTAINMDANIKKLTVTVEWDYRTRRIAEGDPMRKDFVTYFTPGGINRR